MLTRKLSTRLILTYVSLGALPIVIVSVFLISITQRTVQLYIHQRNLETARRASNEISLFIKEPLTILHTLTLTRDILDMERFSQSRAINKIKEENPIFQKIFILDKAGTVTVTTSFGEEFQNFSEEPFFTQASRGELYFSEVYFTPSRFPVMLVAEPIQRYNQNIGVLAAEIDLKFIWDLVDQITIGKTGNAFLLSGEGVVIAHKNKEKVLEKESFADFSFFKALLKGKPGITNIDIDNRDQVLAYFPVPLLHWGIVIQQSQKEAFTLARQLQYRVIFFVALTTLIAVFLGILGVRRFTQPLYELVHGARVLAGGELGYRIELQRKDELAELAQEFNVMARSLEKNQKELQRMERLAALSRFAALVSHEVRNPLNSMTINMQILKRLINREDIPPDQKLKYLNVLSSEIARINELVTNFLAITRPPELNLVRMDIHLILDDVLLVQNARASSEGIQVIKDYALPSIVGMFDHNQLKQVFHNILINAFDAMPDGGQIKISTSISEKKVEGRGSQPKVVIIFEDNGEGISDSALREVFDFYYTTKRTGTGLGLAIAKQIIEAHRGKIHLESQIGKGTKVSIELPVDKQYAESPAGEKNSLLSNSRRRNRL